MNPIQALRGFLERRNRPSKQRVKRNTRLVVESLEGRRVLSASNALPAISGTVFADANNNGTVDPGEAIQGAQVVLWLDDGDGVFNAALDTQVTTLTTDADGEYCFDNLDQDSNYFIEQIAQTVAGVDLPQAVSDLIECEPQLIIDTFVTTQTTIAVPPPVSMDQNALTVNASEAIGGERDLAVELSAGTSEVQLRVNPFGLDDVLLFDSSAGTVGERVVTWDGVDGAGDVLGFGLGGMDLTQGGTLGGFTMLMGVDANGANARLRLYQGGAGNFSEATVPIPVTGGAATQFVFVPFSSFTGPSLEGNVDAIQLFIDTGNRSVDGQIDTIGVLGPKIADFANDVQIDVELNKTVDATLVDNGDTVTWTITVTNNQTNANAPATNVEITDILPAGVTLLSTTPSTGTVNGTTWTLGNLNPGDIETLEIQTTVDQGVTGGTFLENTAQVTAHDQEDIDSEPANDDGDRSEDDEDNAAITLREVVDLEITKVSNTAMAQVGDQVTFTITITNNATNANTSATGVQVTDTLPPGMTLVSTTPSVGSFSNGTWSLVDPLPPGGAQTLQVVATVDNSVAGESKLTNVAQVSAVNEPDFDSGPNNDDGDQSEDDEDNAMFMVGSLIDLELDKSTNVSTVEAGDTVIWTINVTNNPANANAAATNVQITDAIPAGLSVVSAVPSGNGTFSNGVWSLIDPLQPGSVATLMLTTTVNQGVGGMQIVNSAEVTSADQPDFDSIPDNDDGDRSEDEEDEAVIVLTPQIDLELTKTVDQTTVLAGGQVVWTVTVTNNAENANTDATGVTISDVLPTGLSLVSANASSGSVNGSTWTLGGPIAPGSSETLTLTTTVDPNAPTTIENVAEVAGANEPDVDSAPGNDDGDQSQDDEDSAQIIIDPLQIDLELTKTVNQSNVNVGDQVFWTVTLTNNAANANTSATGVTVSDVLPAGLTLVSANASSGSVTGSVWTLGGPIAPGGSETLMLTTTVDANAPTTIENVAEVASANETDIDSIPGNDDGDQSQDDEDNAMITIDPLVIDLELSKNVNATQVDVGDQVTWTISVTNNGANANTSATGVQIADVLPTGVTFQNANTSNGSFNNNIWSLGSPLAPGATATLTIVTSINNNAAGGDELCNTAQVSAANETDFDSIPGNDDGDQSEDDEAKAQVTLREIIDLDIDKTVDKTNVSVGDIVTWSVTVRNDPAIANTAATSVLVEDVLPSGVDFVSANASNGSYNDGTGIWTLAAPLDPGDSATLTIRSTVNSNATGSNLFNVAEIRGHDQLDFDSIPGNDDGDQSEDDEDPANVIVALARPALSKRALLASS